jgi:hypothetical protein
MPQENCEISPPPTIRTNGEGRGRADRFFLYFATKKCEKGRKKEKIYKKKEKEKNEKHPESNGEIKYFWGRGI